MDEDSLLLWAERQNFRARGSSKKRWIRDLDRANDVRRKLKAAKPVPLASYFVNATDRICVQLPPPVSIETMCRVVESLDEIREAFQARMSDLKAIGHAVTLDCAEWDLELIDEAIRATENLVCGFTGETPRHEWKD